MLLGGLLSVACAGGASAAAPLDIDRVANELGLPSDALPRVRRGEIVAFEPPPSSARELAVGLTFLVPRPTADVVAAFRSAVDARGDPQVRDIHLVHGLREFSDLVVPADEARRYVDARPGDDLNLSQTEIAMFRALGAAGGGARVGDTIGRMLFERYRAYVGGGLEGIAPYARSRGGERRPAEEILSACDAAPLLRRRAPLAWDLLRSYPQMRPPGLEEAFYLVQYELDGRPNFTLRHRMAVPFDGGVVAIERDFYVSHGYNTSQAIAGLIAIAEGTIVFYVNRVSTDQLEGLGSSLKQAIGRSVMARQLTAMFERSRACFTAGTGCDPALEAAPRDD